MLLVDGGTLALELQVRGEAQRSGDMVTLESLGVPIERVGGWALVVTRGDARTKIRPH